MAACSRERPTCYASRQGEGPGRHGRARGKVPTPVLVTGSTGQCPMLSNGRIDHDVADTSIGRSGSAASLGSHSYSRTSGS
jgi:hypothetical protein